MLRGVSPGYTAIDFTLKWSEYTNDLHVLCDSQIEVEKDFFIFLRYFDFCLTTTIYFSNDFIYRFSHTIFFSDFVIRFFAFLNYKTILEGGIIVNHTYSWFKVIVKFWRVSVKRLEAEGTFKLFHSPNFRWCLFFILNNKRFFIEFRIILAIIMLMLF